MAVFGSAIAEHSFPWQRTLAGNTPLGQNEIHLWLINIEELLQSAGHHFLADLENNRSSRIVDEKHRGLYPGGRLGLRLLVSAYSEIENNELQFGYGYRGKPKLINICKEGELCFNYTLSRGYALYAFAWNRQLGVDLEIYPRQINAHLMAQRKLTALEKSDWQALPDDLKNQGMLSCWTRKEAYGKVLGIGIRYFMNQVALFKNLQSSSWQTEVTGLFDIRDARMMQSLAGLQLGLPVAGAATLMYDISLNSGNSELPNPEDNISAFRLAV